MTDTIHQIMRLLPNEKTIVLCGRGDDAEAWQQLLGRKRCLAVALDDAPADERPEQIGGASGHLAWQHAMIAGLDDDNWLGQQARRFDPDARARLLLPDPLDPPEAGRREGLGRQHPTWRLFEDKTAVDALWDQLDVPRAVSIVTDADADLAMLGALVDHGSGVACAAQPASCAPAAGGDGLWWWYTNEQPTATTLGPRTRVRLMPLLEGLPVRLHGLACRSGILPFPPMELVTLPRIARGTFLLAGAVPTSPPQTPELVACTKLIGERLRDRLGYRGAFAVDGILTTSDGFLPTDFNPRLTSAIEPAPSELRVQLHAANLLTRDGTEPGLATMRQLVDAIFAPADAHTLYGAATTARLDGREHAKVRWYGDRLLASEDSTTHGQITLAPSVRGWLLTARLAVDHLPTGGPLGTLAPHVFQLSDRLFGTDFGQLGSPFGLHSALTLPTTSRLRGGA